MPCLSTGGRLYKIVYTIENEKMNKQHCRPMPLIERLCPSHAKYLAKKVTGCKDGVWMVIRSKMSMDKIS